jgi:hypothetical protein
VSGCVVTFVVGDSGSLADPVVTLSVVTSVVTFVGDSGSLASPAVLLSVVTSVK